MHYHDRKPAAGATALTEALRRTVAASALGMLITATPAAAHTSGTVAEGAAALAGTASVDPAVGATIKLPDPEGLGDAARAPVVTPYILAGCTIGHSSYEQFTCN